jgi:hypothetical protein
VTKKDGIASEEINKRKNVRQQKLQSCVEKNTKEKTKHLCASLVPDSISIDEVKFVGIRSVDKKDDEGMADTEVVVDAGGGIVVVV